MEALAELWTWLANLDAPFAFLLALPLVVGALGVVALLIEQRRRALAQRSSSRLQRSGRPAHVQ
jgi:hypothetical protein